MSFSTPPFSARLPGLAQQIRIATFQDAMIFTRRWTIRDKDRALKKVLKRLERANSSESAERALNEMKSALLRCGLLSD